MKAGAPPPLNARVMPVLKLNGEQMDNIHTVLTADVSQTSFQIWK